MHNKSTPLSDPATEEEVTHSIGRDRAKVAVRKGEEKEGSSSKRVFLRSGWNYVYSQEVKHLVC
jgi:hypothetical protein